MTRLFRALRSLDPVRRLLPAALSLASQIASSPLAAGWPRHTIDASSRGADGVRLGDADGDGRLDIVTGWEEGGIVRLYLNPGPAAAGKPWPRVTVGRAPSVEDALLVDLDRDGRPDVLSACEGRARRLQVHWGPPKAQILADSAWRTETVPSSAGRMMWMYAAAAPFTSEGPLQIAAGGKGQGAEVGLWVPGGTPRAVASWHWRPLRPAGWIMSLEAADMDGDGDLDLLLSDRKGPRRGVWWLENPGNAKGRWQEHAVGSRGREVMFCDLERTPSGGLRIACAVKPREVHVHRLEDGRVATEVIPFPQRFGTAKAVRFADLDGDGRTDIAFTCEEARGGRSGTGWLRRLEDGGWEALDIGGPGGVKFDLVQCIDLDGDGDLDFLTCEERENLGVIWYENPLRSRKRP